MADCVKTILNSNPIRNGSRVVLANKFGTIGKLDSLLPDGSLGTVETKLTDRYNEFPETPSVNMYDDYVTVPASGTEVAWAVPEGAEKFLFKCRTQNDIQYGYSSSHASGAAHTTLFGGTAYESPSDMNFKANQSIYFTGASGLVVELNYWR